jgi:hypothetical protein
MPIVMFYNADVGMEVIVLMGVHYKNIFHLLVKTLFDCLHDVWIHVKLKAPGIRF